MADTPATTALEAELREMTERAEAAERRALAAETACEEFVRIAAHELRGQMSTIMLACEVVAVTSADAGVGAHLRTIERCIARTEQVLGKLQLLLSLERDGLALNCERLDARTIIWQCQEEYGALAERRGYAVEARMPEHPVIASLDRTRMTEALGDLLQRAIALAQRPGLTLELEEQPDELVFSVVIPGLVIDPGERERVFARAWRGPTGSGALELGAAVARAIAHGHGGRSALHSAPGESRLVLCIPRDPAPGTVP